MARRPLRYLYERDEFRDAMQAIYRPIAVAATGAMRETEDAIKRRGRKQILDAGFSKAYSTAFRVDSYPIAPKVSAKPALIAQHKVEFSELFETGARISGKPIMWVPIQGAGNKIGKKQLRLKDFIARGEKLVMVKRPGKPPLLFGRPLSGMTRPRRSHQRDGYRRYGSDDMVPLFIGLSVVDIPKKFRIYQMIEREADRMIIRYARHLDPES